MVKTFSDAFEWVHDGLYELRNLRKARVTSFSGRWVYLKIDGGYDFYVHRNTGKASNGSIESPYDVVDGPIPVTTDNNDTGGLSDNAGTGGLSYSAGRLSWSEDSPYKDFNYPRKATGEELDTAFTSALKTQIGGSHYADNPIQPIEFIGRNNMSFTVGNIIKYAVRADKKNGKEDLKKCIHYAQIELELKYGVKSKVEYDDN